MDPRATDRPSEEIEVTPEMIEAALHKLWRQDRIGRVHDVMDVDRGVVGAMLR